jgi:hypothetical protein
VLFNGQLSIFVGDVVEVLGDVEFEIDFARIQVMNVAKRTTILLENIMKSVGNDGVRN